MYKVSVIVLIYNSEQNLGRCLDSIRNQTYKNIEIILIDNGSTDNSQQIIKGYARFDKRIKLLYMNNGKLYDEINYATEHATGQYVLYVDSNDSWLDKKMINLMVEKQEKYKSDAIQIDSYYVYFDKLLYDDRYNKKDGEGLILDNKCLMEELEINGRVKNVIWGKLYKINLIKRIVFGDEEKINELQWLYKLMSMIERYVILHKPVIYNIKQN